MAGRGDFLRPTVQHIEQLAGRLAAEGEPGDRVAVLAFNCPQLLQLIYAAPAAGQVLVPLNARLAPAEIRAQIRRSGARHLFGDPQLLKTLTQDDDPAPVNESIAVIPFDEHFQSLAVGPLCNNAENQIR